MKFIIVDLRVMPFNNFDFRENRCTESYTLLRGVNEILPIFSTFFLSDLDKIWCKMSAADQQRVKRKSVQWKVCFTDRA